MYYFNRHFQTLLTVW